MSSFLTSFFNDYILFLWTVSRNFLLLSQWIMATLTYKLLTSESDNLRACTRQNFYIIQLDTD